MTYVGGCHGPAFFFAPFTYISPRDIDHPQNYTFGNVSLVVRGAANMIISAEPGAELVFAIGAGLNFVECANVTTQDLVIDYYPS